jgi:lysyl-tRNA synthetase class II
MAQGPSDQEIVRREALQKLRARGIEPYPAAEFAVTHDAAEVKGLFKEGGEPVNVTVAGRMMSVRVMGKASFAVLRDHTGDQQIYVARDEIAPGEDKSLYDEVWKHLLHLGDFIGVKGHVFKTRTGEITVHVKELTVLSKALRPLPVVKWLRGGGHPRAAAHSWGRDRTPLHHAPQCARHPALPAHRERALPQAPHRGRLPWRVRVQPRFPE